MAMATTTTTTTTNTGIMLERRGALPGSRSLHLSPAHKEVVKAGTVLWSEEALAYCGAPEMNEVCDHCLVPVDSLPVHCRTAVNLMEQKISHPNVERPPRMKRCGGCRVVKYCSQKCQAAAWKRWHRHECHAMKQLGLQGVSIHSTIVFGRLLLTNQLHVLNNMSASPTLISGHVLDDDDDDDDDDDNYGGESMSSIVSHLPVMDIVPALQLDEYLHYLKSHAGRKMNRRRLFRLWRRFANNATSIHNDLTTLAGNGLFELVAQLNHSCVPNVNRLHDGPVVKVVANTDIQPGDELTTQYCDVNNLRETRRRHLRMMHGFVCMCVRCSDESPNSLDAMLESGLSMDSPQARKLEERGNELFHRRHSKKEVQLKSLSDSMNRLGLHKFHYLRQPLSLYIVHYTPHGGELAMKHAHWMMEFGRLVYNRFHANRFLPTLWCAVVELYHSLPNKSIKKPSICDELEVVARTCFGADHPCARFATEVVQRAARDTQYRQQCFLQKDRSLETLRAFIG